MIEPLLDACAAYVRAGRGARARALAMVRDLRALDPRAATRYQASVVVRAGRPEPWLRLWNLDNNVYAARSSEGYVLRLDGFRAIVGRRARTGAGARAFAAFEGMAGAGADLFFGGDFSGARSRFGLCAAFGGVGRDGVARFCAADSVALTRGALRAAGFRAPSGALAGPRVLNVAFDLEASTTRARTYRLCADVPAPGSVLSRWHRAANSVLKGAAHFTFFSRSFGLRGGAVRDKLFVEWVQPPSAASAAAAARELVGLGLPDVRTALAAVPGSLDCLGFEADGTATVYLRPVDSAPPTGYTAGKP